MAISFDLQGKVILITGASSGIGREIAKQAASAGARILLSGRDKERLYNVATECGTLAVSCPYDLNDIEGIPAFVRKISKEYGPLAGLVHSAGVEQIIPLQGLQSQNLFDIFQINVVAGIMLLKGMATRRCHTDTSSAVFLSSVAGRVGKPGLTGYSISKGAIEQAVKVLALELLPHHIRVNAVAPAMIRTPMVEKLWNTLSEHEQGNIIREHPGGIGFPEDVAAAVIYLLSDASKFVTGTSILVDGGYCAQ